MDSLIVKGGLPLEGDVVISGAKNSALPILISSLLTEEELTIGNIPNLRDINTTLDLLSCLGAVVTPHKKDKNKFSVLASDLTSLRAPYELVKTMRASILVLGPLLARFGEAEVSLPGGCAIGSRPIDLHVSALEQMGAEITVEQGYIKAGVINQKLQGAKIFFDKVTVTGTENIMMAATLADGATVLENAAKEPEIIDLANCLVSMGAKIDGAGTDVITVHGVEKLGSATHHVIPDRIEAGTFLVAGAITKGNLHLHNVYPCQLETVSMNLRNAGAKISEGSNDIKIEMPRRPRATSLTTSPYPGFPTDMQAQFVVLNCVSTGTATITERIFENRFMHVEELRRMGANIELIGNTAVIHGVDFLRGAQVMATDLRASACLVLAGLVSSEKTIIDRIYHIDRGYEKIESKLANCGADISRIR